MSGTYTLRSVQLSNKPKHASSDEKRSSANEIAKPSIRSKPSRTLNCPCPVNQHSNMHEQTPRPEKPSFIKKLPKKGSGFRQRKPLPRPSMTNLDEIRKLGQKAQISRKAMAIKDASCSSLSEHRFYKASDTSKRRKDSPKKCVTAIRNTKLLETCGTNPPTMMANRSTEATTRNFKNAKQSTVTTCSEKTCLKQQNRIRTKTRKIKLDRLLPPNELQRLTCSAEDTEDSGYSPTSELLASCVTANAESNVTSTRSKHLISEKSSAMGGNVKLIRHRQTEASDSRLVCEFPESDLQRNTFSSRSRSKRKSLTTSTASRDSSVTSAASSFANRSLSKSLCEPPRHHCDLMGPPWRKSEHRRSSSICTSDSSIIRSCATPASSTETYFCTASKRCRTRKVLWPQLGKSGSADDRKAHTIDNTSKQALSTKKTGLLRTVSNKTTRQKMGDLGVGPNFVPSLQHLEYDSAASGADNNNNLQSCSTTDARRATSNKEELSCSRCANCVGEPLVLGPLLSSSIDESQTVDGVAKGCSLALLREDFLDVKVVLSAMDESNSKTTLTGFSEEKCVDGDLTEAATFQTSTPDQTSMNESCPLSTCVLVHSASDDSFVKEDAFDENDFVSENTSICSLASGDETSNIEKGSRNDVLVNSKVNHSKKTTPSKASPTSLPTTKTASWTKNRSFFLRVTENRRKQHKREWENNRGRIVWDRWTSNLQRDEVLQNMSEELEEARSIIKMQENELETLREEVCRTREEAVEEEILRIEAETFRDQAEVESKVFETTIRFLEERMKPSEHIADHVGETCSKSDDPVAEPEMPQQTSFQSVQALAGGDQRTPRESSPAEEAKQSCDEGYFSMKRKAVNGNDLLLSVQSREIAYQADTDGQVSHIVSSYADECLSPTIAKESRTERDSKPCVSRREKVKTDLKHAVKNDFFAFLSHALLLSTLLNSSDPSTIDVQRLLNQRFTHTRRQPPSLNYLS